MSGQSDLILSRPNVEEPGADRRVEPLVEARAVVVGPELVAREGKVREGMSSVDEHLNAVGFASSTISFTGAM